jgi:hypothetical protein
MTTMRKNRAPFGDASDKKIAKAAKAQKKANVDCAATWYLEVEKENNGKIPHGGAKRISERFGVDLNALNYAVKWKRKAVEKVIEKVADTTPVTVDEETEEQENDEEQENVDPTPPSKKGGRPKGSTSAAKRDVEDRLQKAHTYAATQVELTSLLPDNTRKFTKWRCATKGG